MQDQSSVDLIASIGIHSCTLSGDTRFDRVAERAETPRSFPEIAQLKNGRKTMVAGSTWTADERLILDSGCFSDEKNLLVLVPHETSERAIELLMSKAGSKAIRFSHWDKKDLHFNILVIDLIGMLSSLYQYADVTYVGGGFGAGIHNTLEAVAFGAPVIFGPNYEKFREAKELIESGGGFCINNQNEFKDIFEKLMSDENLRKQISLLNKDYIRKKSGATEKIISFLKHHRS